jgi:translation initiation factor IF-2
VVQDLAKLLGITPIEAMKALIRNGIMAAVNQSVDYAAAALVAQEVGFTPEPEAAAAGNAVGGRALDEDGSAGQPRPPVVTIMGHVDHGKTSLLDYIRKTNVTAGEVGGITQRIGAYQVEVDGQKIPFIDTPGHEAFTAMRARGAQATDIAVLVVAADDGLMPQSVEAIDHARAAGVPIVVAINKMDREEANPDRVKQQLTEHNLVVEEYGGDTIAVPVSARTGEGVGDLLANIAVLAEVSELTANPDQPGRGVILEAELDKTRGPMASVLVRTGTLRVGDYIVAGAAWGKVRALFDDRGKRVESAGPSMPVKLMGLGQVPEPGDVLQVVPDEARARALVAEQTTQAAGVSLEHLSAQIQAGETKDLNVIIKADFQGSIDAIRNALQKIEVAQARVNIVHTAAGSVTDSDVLLAAASNAIIVGFNTRSEPSALRLADREKVQVRFYQIIYELVDDIERSVRGLLEPVSREVFEGRAEVRQIFSVRNNNIAGCWVRDGRILRGAQARLMRGGRLITESRVSSLRHFREDVREMAAGFECGIVLEGFNDYREGDIIETYRRERVGQ